MEYLERELLAPEPDDPIKTGNGKCGYLILPNNLCGANPGWCGGYLDCNEDDCPIEKNKDGDLKHGNC